MFGNNGLPFTLKYFCFSEFNWLAYLERLSLLDAHIEAFYYNVSDQINEAFTAKNKYNQSDYEFITYDKTGNLNWNDTHYIVDVQTTVGKSREMVMLKKYQNIGHLVDSKYEYIEFTKPFITKDGEFYQVNLKLCKNQRCPKAALSKPICHPESTETCFVKEENADDHYIKFYTNNFVYDITTNIKHLYVNKHGDVKIYTPGSKRFILLLEADETANVGDQILYPLQNQILNNSFVFEYEVSIILIIDKATTDNRKYSRN